jgi:hypothetical protein
MIGVCGPDITERIHPCDSCDHKNGRGW